MRFAKQTVLLIWMIAMAVCAKEPLIGEAKIDDSWKKDSYGNWQGTLGSSWKKDSYGNWQGAGKNSGIS